ncbi:hypothetical protein NBRC116187_13300 [Halopseudomonas sabulinigri]|uniref:Sulfatase N-terminal domain-containing protein n=2 Tax=Halopseudomonas sabulinigri TaxID=472181 RepID=A0ABP9ZNE4_9GAMM
MAGCIGYVLVTLVPKGELVAEVVRPNVFIIGIDSLSGSAFDQFRNELPAVSSLMEQGASYERAYTVLGRTYPAWVTILTGDYPVANGAFFNLRELSYSSAGPNVLASLKKQGYQTTFALDERRFNNMGETFGFDGVVGPKAGVLDFLAQPIVDTPLSNALLQWGLTARLMPWTKNNVAAHQAYSASGFVEDVLAELDVQRSNFLSVHFETSHFPFKTRHGGASNSAAEGLEARYVNALQVVDGQVGQLVAGLERRGFLQNALVVVLSDHGEALGGIEADISVGGERQKLASYGHGTHLLSDHQSRIVLGVINYENGVVIKPRSSHVERQVSLLDVRELIEGYVATGNAELKPGSECIFVETGLRLPAAENYENLNEAELVKQGAGYYQVSPNGLLSLREERMAELLSSKDIGVRCRDRIVWYSPNKQRYYAYSLTADGKPLAEEEPDTVTIENIKRYRERYNAL